MKYPLRAIAGVTIAGSVACGPPPNTRPLTPEEAEIIADNIQYGQDALLLPVQELARRSTVAFGIDTPHGTSHDFANSISACDKRLTEIHGLEHIVYGTEENAKLFDDNNDDTTAYFDDNGKRGPSGDPARDYIVANPYVSPTKIGYALLMHETCHTFGEHTDRVDEGRDLWTAQRTFREAVAARDLAQVTGMVISGYEYVIDLARTELPTDARGISSQYRLENRTAFAVARDFADLYFYVETTPADDLWIGDIGDALQQTDPSGPVAVFTEMEVNIIDIQESLALVEDPEEHRIEVLEEIDTIVAETQEMARERGEEIDVESALAELYDEAGIERPERGEEFEIMEPARTEAELQRSSGLFFR